MKVAINSCYGGFSLSCKATKRLAKLNDKECYFFEEDHCNPDKVSYIKLDRKEESKVSFPIPFDVNNPNDYHSKELWNAHSLYEFQRPHDRSDPKLIQVIEELGADAASGKYAKIKIIDIPDNIDYEINDYDGMEYVEEVHRSWS